jgi:threonylcarbamoyladenosine tRNA methylthiotransferase MtaB
MKRVALETVGCRLNQYDTEKIAARLSECGFNRVNFSDEADLYIVNTCTVTGRADASCRNIISRAARREGAPPVVVVGCYVDSDEGKVASLNGVDLVVSNQHKENIVSILKQNFPRLFDKSGKALEIDHISEFHDHNRAWIKIGDGCNQHCAYCIIPSVRGPLTNRPAAEIIEEINSLAKNGYKEVVLTGVHIGLYQDNGLKSVAGLVRHILDNSDIARLRLSSIEPQEVNDDLVGTIIKGGERVCRHLHVPLQSGSDRILKLMRRPYNVSRYLQIVENVRNKIRDIIIGADIIVGFPGETEDDFQRSFDAADSGLLDYLHVFSYSDRPGTAASEMGDKVHPEVIKHRNSVLREISEKRYALALKKQVGKTVKAISEHRSDKQRRYWGITDNYLKILLPEGSGGGREILNLSVVNATNEYLLGDLYK